MKLVKHFDAFLVNKVNLSDGRIALLDSRVTAVTNFLSAGDDVYAENFIDLIPQGSYAHRTIINPVGAFDEFDADVLLHIEEVDGWNAEDYVQKLYEVFRTSATYKVMVSRHDRCVKVDYANEFHIDVVPYMTRHDQKYITNRVTNAYELTNPEGYNEWLDDRNRLASGRLIKVIRLMKYLRDYKNTFSVKSVILSILLGGRVNDAAVFGGTSDYPDVPTALKNIVGALDDYLQANLLMPSIDDPSQPTENFNHRWDQQQYANFRKVLHFYRGWIDDAFNETDLEESKKKWRKLFGDKFASYDTSMSKSSTISLAASAGIRDTEETIESRWNIPVALDPRYFVKIGGRVAPKSGFRTYELSRHGNTVLPGRRINFRIKSSNIPEPYELYWKVLNRGEDAVRRDCLRGQIERDTGQRTWSEPTSFRGAHYVECYAVRGGICIAMDRQYVIIR